MKMTCKKVAVIGTAFVFLPMVMAAQMDQSGGNAGANGFPQQGSTMSQSNDPGGSQRNVQANTQGMSPSQRSQPGSMRDSLGAPGQTGQQMMDRQFVRQASEASVAGIQLSTLALAKGSDGVKAVAQKLIDDHTAMNRDLGTIADSMGIMVPKKMNKDAQREYEKLDGLSGKDFDTEYLSYMTKAHFEDMHNFHMEASASASSDLTAEVIKDMGMMHRHMRMIANAAGDLGITLPSRPQRPAVVSAAK